MTVDKIAAYSSDEEDELWFIPTALADPDTEHVQTETGNALPLMI